MIRLIPANKRHFSDFGWLKTFWLFSFSDYYDPDNIEFGSIRVFNDDVIVPNSGFPMHDHDNMEIISIILDGEITHTDNIGNAQTLTKGDVQIMSAGRGVTHSEYNHATASSHFFQIWVKPKTQNLAPTYRQKNFLTLLKNRLTPIASGKKITDSLHINSNATLYLGEIEKDGEIVCSLNASHGTFIYVFEGSIKINDTCLESGDQARITNKESLDISSRENARFILIDTHL